ncbi:DUF551 domain-containing protein [Enterobacter asburiae]|nr:DUF551 domain-containing protein [Enterobacter asburiae]
MSTITKEWLKQAINDYESVHDELPFGLDDYQGKILAAMRIALASLEAEAVGEVVLGEYDDCGCHPDARVVCIAADGQADWENFKDGTRLYTAQPAPVSVKIPPEKPHTDGPLADGWNACRAAMLQGAEPVTTAYKLPFEQWLSQQGERIEIDCGCVSVEVFMHWLRMAYGDGNSPVITGGWVACSERMPTPNQYVLVCNGVWVGMGMHNNSEHLEDDERWQDERHEFIDLLHHPVTHWMPLPAAPQQQEGEV